MNRSSFAESTLETLHLLATTIAQRHARSHERNTADNEDLARKRRVITGLGERGRRGLFLGNGGLCSSLRNLRLGRGSALG